MNDNMVRISSQSWSNMILHTSDSGSRKIFYIDFAVIQWTWYGVTFNVLYYAISQNINSLRVLYRIIYLTFFFVLIVFSSIFLCCFNILNIIIIDIIIAIVLLLLLLILSVFIVLLLILSFILFLLILLLLLLQSEDFPETKYW